jgi:opacity protein-like surface antigen
MSRLSRALLAATLALVVCPAVAAADSIVYVKDSNVWLAKPDGTGQYQVTSDGTAEDPYRSPSQDDDGTIAVGYGERILRMRQNGEVLDELDPPMLMNSVSHPMDGAPVDVAISPDGTKVAYSFYGYECPVGASCGARTVTGIIPSDRFSATATYRSSYFRTPSWVTNSRILNSGGFGSHINIQELGTKSYNWVTDMETDLGDAEMTRAGDKLVAVRGYGSSTHIVWYRVNGERAVGRQAAGADAAVPDR